jgi:alpha-beta hydrolase superfamily lysophospholipase
VKEALTIRASDGLSLTAAHWPAAAPERGVVVLVHGLGEHMARYAHVVARLQQAGLAVLAFDHRGHGTSPGPRGFTPSFPRMIDDVQSAIDAAAARHPGLPVFLYGHSLGGLLVMLTGMQRRPAVRGIVASAPFLRPAFKPPAGKVLLARAAARIWPGLIMASGLDPNGLSRDPAVVQAYVADPLVHDRISSCLGAGLFEGGEWALAHASEMRIPLLLMHGSQDPLTSSAASREFAASSRNGCVLRIWDGLYHEIHNEPERAAVLDTACEWFDSRLA